MDSRTWMGRAVMGGLTRGAAATSLEQRIRLDCGKWASAAGYIWIYARAGRDASIANCE